MLFRTSRTFFPRAAYFALLAIMLQVWMPLFTQAAMAANPQSVHRICSAFTQPTQQDTDQSGKVKTASCPMCQSLHHLSGGFVPPHDVVIARATTEAERLIIFNTFQAPKPDTYSSVQPRAPPSLA